MKPTQEPVTYVRLRLPRFALAEARAISEAEGHELGDVLSQWVMQSVYEHRRRRREAEASSSLNAFLAAARERAGPGSTS